MLLRVIQEVREETCLCLHAYVVMPDHIHLVLTPPVGLRVGRIMQLVKVRFANRFNRATGGSGSLWQERYHERALRSEKALRAAVEYVHHNPVVAGLCESAEDYRWSSAGAVASPGPQSVRLRA